MSDRNGNAAVAEAAAFGASGRTGPLRTAMLRALWSTRRRGAQSPATRRVIPGTAALRRGRPSDRPR